MRKIFLVFLLASLQASAQYNHKSNPGVRTSLGGAVTSAGSGNCPGTGCLALNTEGTPAYVAVISGTYAATLAFECSNDGWTTVVNVTGYPLTNGLPGSPALNAGANGTGTWWVPTMGYRECGLYASAFTSNTSMALRLDADPGTSPYVTSLLNGTDEVNGLVQCAAAAPGTQIVAANVNRAGVALQNLSSTATICISKSLTAMAACPPTAASSTTGSYVLRAGSLANDGTGGTLSLSNYTGPLACMSSAGTVNLAVLTFAR